MKPKQTLSLIGLGLAVTLISIYILRPFFHTATHVNFANRIEEFKVSGVPNFNLASYDTHTFLPLLHGVKLQDFKTDLVLVNFWATWCAPCITEFPSLVELARQLGPKKITVLAISVDKNISEIKGFLGANGIPPSNFMILLDPSGAVAATYGTIKIPETFLLDREHRLLRKVIDSQNWVSPDFLHFISGLVPSAGAAQ